MDEAQLQAAITQCLAALTTRLEFLTASNNKKDWLSVEQNAIQSMSILQGILIDSTLGRAKH